MAFPESHAISLDVDKGTVGGDTYWVELPAWRGSQKALCWRKSKQNPGQRCGAPAGGGTDHHGTGACRMHGGVFSGTHIVDGRHAKVAKGRLTERIDAFLESGDDAKLYDLSKEMAAMKLLFQDLLESFPDPDSPEYARYTNKAIGMIQAIGSLVDKISKVESRNTLTAAQVLYLRASVANILIKYIPNVDRRMLALEELSNSMPGGKNDGRYADVVQAQ